MLSSALVDGYVARSLLFLSLAAAPRLLRLLAPALLRILALGGALDATGGRHGAAAGGRTAAGTRLLHGTRESGVVQNAGLGTHVLQHSLHQELSQLNGVCLGVANPAILHTLWRPRALC